MRSKVLSVGLTLGVGLLLVTNPVVVNAAALISGKDIKNESVTSKDIKNGSLKSKDFKSGQLPAGARPGATGAALVRPVRPVLPGRATATWMRPARAAPSTQ